MENSEAKNYPTIFEVLKSSRERFVVRKSLYIKAIRLYHKSEIQSIHYLQSENELNYFYALREFLIEVIRLDPRF